MIRVGISGAGGKLATAIAEAVLVSDDLELSALFNPNRAGQEMHGVTVTGAYEAVDAEVIVETAHPEIVFDNLEHWRAGGVATVIGTSGFTPERLQRLKDSWGSDGPPCLVVPNFSIGAVLMMRFAAESAPHFEVGEIVERHHTTKPDAPSGTALATAMGMASAGGSSSEHSSELVAGSRGGRVQGVRVHSVRLPGVIAQQEVVLSNDGEVLSIGHLSTSYRSFAGGALLAVRGVASLPPGVHLGLETLL